MAGEQIHDTIRRVLQDCKTAVVIWTSSSIQSHWVLGEDETAAADGKLITTRSDALPIADIPIPFLCIRTIAISDREGRINAVAAKLPVAPRR